MKHYGAAENPVLTAAPIVLYYARRFTAGGSLVGSASAWPGACLMEVVGSASDEKRE